MALSRMQRGTWDNEKWKRKSRSNTARHLKRCVAKSERHKANLNPECEPEYKRFTGYEL